jgi:O-antigen/teichoic acid export membrane protein
LLVIDNFILVISGWLFWIVTTKFATAGEIGSSTAIITLMTFISGLLILGFEFPLLKDRIARTDSANQNADLVKEKRKPMFWTIFLFAMGINLAAMPILWLVLSGTFATATSDTLVFALSLFLITGLSTISKYALLGILSTKLVLMADIVATLTRFSVAIPLLVYGGQAVFAVVFGNFMSALLLCVIVTIGAVVRLGTALGTRKELLSSLKEALSNFPSKIARFSITPLAIILLTFAGVSASEIGIFFVALIISLAAGSLASSITTVSLPASSEGGDSFRLSLKLGLTLTTPFIVILFVFPGNILSLIDTGYAAGSNMLSVLALAVFPSTMLFNLIMRLNSQSDNRMIILIGVTQLAVLGATFAILVDEFTGLGAAVSILAAYSIPAALLLRRLTKEEHYLVIKTIIAIAAGVVIGVFIQYVVTGIIAMVAAFLFTFAAMHLLRALRFREISDLVISIRHRT